MNKEKRLLNKKTIVTGGARGIGAGIVKRLYSEGAEIIIADLSKGKVLKIEKVSGDIVSEPFIFDNNLYVVRNGSIIKYN